MFFSLTSLMKDKQKTFSVSYFISINYKKLPRLLNIVKATTFSCGWGQGPSRNQATKLPVKKYKAPTFSHHASGPIKSAQSRPMVAKN